MSCGLIPNCAGYFSIAMRLENRRQTGAAVCRWLANRNCVIHSNGSSISPTHETENRLLETAGSNACARIPIARRPSRTGTAVSS